MDVFPVERSDEVFTQFQKDLVGNFISFMFQILNDFG